MIRSCSGKALAFLAVLGGALTAAPASAVCVPVWEFISQDIAIDMGNVTIPPGLAVGAVIQEMEVPLWEQHAVECDPNGGLMTARFVHANRPLGMVGPSGNNYATDVAGVGIRIAYRLGPMHTWIHFPHDQRLERYARLTMRGHLRVQLIKTEALTGSGRIAPLGRFTTLSVDGDPARPLVTSSFRGRGTTVVGPTCEVDASTRNIVVDFGTVSNTDFTGVGSQAADRDFNIRLNCEGAGSVHRRNAVRVRLHADADNPRMPGVLRLTPFTDSATNIGIQMVRRDGRNEHQLRFGEPIHLGMMTAESSTLDLPLRARYVQTRPGLVGTGVASGRATFTIEYD